MVETCAPRDEPNDARAAAPGKPVKVVKLSANTCKSSSRCSKASGAFNRNPNRLRSSGGQPRDAAYAERALSALRILTASVATFTSIQPSPSARDVMARSFDASSPSEDVFEKVYALINEVNPSKFPSLY